MGISLYTVFLVPEVTCEGTCDLDACLQVLTKVKSKGNDLSTNNGLVYELILLMLHMFDYKYIVVIVNISWLPAVKSFPYCANSNACWLPS